MLEEPTIYGTISAAEVYWALITNIWSVHIIYNYLQITLFNPHNSTEVVSTIICIFLDKN